MKTRVLAFAAILSTFSPLAAEAIPVKYDLTYVAAVGPSGIGSFLYDAESKSLTSFLWDFDGLNGGLTDWHFSFDVFGDTRGSFLFEMLTQSDAHAGVNCIANGCGTGDSIEIGTGPFGTSWISFTVDPVSNSVGYTFNNNASQIAASGHVLTQQTAVPEPASLFLFGVGLAAMAVGRRAVRKADPTEVVRS